MASLEQKIRLLTGEASFTTYAVEGLDVQSIVLSDGPIGIRGTVEPAPVAAQLPNPTAISAAWDLGLVERLGSLLGREAKRLGIDVVLAPIVNLQRTPVGGRHFETYSEDPLLTAQTMVAFVTAVQAEGVGVCVKHFIGNESETERTSYVAKIDEQTLREVYLAPFEAAVKQAGAWSIMAAYNQVEAGGITAQSTDHGYLINDILKGEWGFDGVVVSDWLATKTTVESANGGLDLVMPGPGGPWEQHLVDAVESGEVAESVIDDKVERMLRLAERVGKRGDDTSAAARQASVPADQAVNDETRALLREAVARSIVVLANRDGALPLAPASVASIALIGPNAVDPFVQGGGSAFVNAPYEVTPEAGLRAAFPDAAITVNRGGSARRFAPLIDPELVTTPNGEAGYEITLLDADGQQLDEPFAVPASEGWNRGIVAGAERAIVHARVELSTPGTHRLEVGLSGSHQAWFDGGLVDASHFHADSNVILNSSANHPEGPSVLIEVAEEESRTVEIEVDAQVVDAGAYSRFVRVELRHEAIAGDTDAEIAAAVAAAAAAEVALVIVGTNEETESEGWDRQNLQLPQRQNELVRRVAAANPKTVVVVNAGAPVILPWIDEVAAVLWQWLPGQELGNGLADALTGATEPSGRLPWTLPAHEEDVPVPHALPVHDGSYGDAGWVSYNEGVHVGHRGWDKLGRTPARPFGFGLGYTSFALSAPVVGALADAGLAVSVTAKNTGARAGRAVVQFYLAAETAGGFDRPATWFAGYASAEIGAGEDAVLTATLPRRAFEVWDAAAHAWTLPAGTYVVRAAFDARDAGVASVVVL